MDDDAVDFAVAAWREDGLWQVVDAPAPCLASTLDSLIERAARAARRGRRARPRLGRRGVLRPRARAAARTSGCCSPTCSPPRTGRSASTRSTGSACPRPRTTRPTTSRPVGDLRIVEDFGLVARRDGAPPRRPRAWPDELLAAIAAPPRLRRAVRPRPRAAPRLTTPLPSRAALRTRSQLGRCAHDSSPCSGAHDRGGSRGRRRRTPCPATRRGAPLAAGEVPDRRGRARRLPAR